MTLLDSVGFLELPELPVLLIVFHICARVVLGFRELYAIQSSVTQVCLVFVYRRWHLWSNQQ